MDTEISQAILTDHFRRPRCAGPLSAPDWEGKTTNPLCGDEVLIALRWSPGCGGYASDRPALEAAFSGQGCAASQAGASLTLQFASGREAAQLRDQLPRFLKLMESPATEAGEDEAAWEEYGAMAALGAFRRIPARVVCATLATRLLLRGIEATAGDHG